MKLIIMSLVMAFSMSSFAVDQIEGKDRTPASTEQEEKLEQGTHTVQGHIRSNGTYVAPYIRTNPDGIKSNNIRR